MRTVVKGDTKALFLIATTPRCKRGCYSIPWIAHFTLDPYLIMLGVKQGSIKYHFLSLWYVSIWDWTQVVSNISCVNRDNRLITSKNPLWIVWQDTWCNIYRYLVEKCFYFLGILFPTMITITLCEPSLIEQGQ